MLDDFSVNTVVEIIVGVAVPVLMLIISQRLERARKEKAVTNAILADITQLLSYIESHIVRVNQYIDECSPRSSRHIRFLKLISVVDSSNIFHDVAILRPRVAYAVAKFYSHFRQNDLILNIVVEEWDERTSEQMNYQRQNLLNLKANAIEVISLMRREYNLE